MQSRIKRYKPNSLYFVRIKRIFSWLFLSKSRIFKFAFILVIITVAYFTVKSLVEDGYGNIDQITIISTDGSVNKEDIYNEYIGKNLFTLDTNEIRDILNSNPFVRGSIIKKYLPSTLYIEIIDNPVAIVYVSLNKVVLLNAQLEIITITEIGEQIDLTETERLVYSDPKTFKSDLLKSKWKDKLSKEIEAESQAKLVELGYNSEIIPSLELELEINNQKAIITDNIFAERSLESLQSVYNELRSEIIFTVETRFNSGLEIVKDRNIPIYYSLVDSGNTENVYKFEILNKFGLIEEIINKSSVELNLKTLRRVFVSRNSIILEHEFSGGKLNISYLLQGDINTYYQNIAAIWNTQNLVNKPPRSIDFSGDKIILIY